MEYLSEKQLNEHIKSKKISSVYFIFGDDHFLIKNAVEKIVKNTVTDFPEFNFNDFKIGADALDICTAASAMPLMAENKCVSVCDVELEKLSSLDFERILSLAEEPNESTVLVFWFEAISINSKKLTERQRKLLKAVEKNGTVAEINHRSIGELATALRKAAQKRGGELEISTAYYLIETCSQDLFTLTNEIEKLAAFCGPRKFTREDVDLVCSKTFEASIFDISKAIITKDIKKALNLLYDLFFMNVPPLTIVYNIANDFIDLSRAKAAVNAGKNINDAAKEFGYKSNVAFRLTNAQRNVRYLSEKQIKKSLNLILDAEEKVKSNKNQAKTLIEQLVIELVLVLQKGE